MQKWFLQRGSSSLVSDRLKVIAACNGVDGGRMMFGFVREDKDDGVRDVFDVVLLEGFKCGLCLLQRGDCMICAWIAQPNSARKYFITMSILV